MRSIRTVAVAFLAIAVILVLSAVFTTALTAGLGRFGSISVGGGLDAKGDACTIVKDDGIPVDCTGTCKTEGLTCTLNSHLCECK